MAWFKREKPGLVPQKKKEMPDGLWVKCTSCGEIIYKKQLEENHHVCTKCEFHFKMRAVDYINLILDEDSFQETDVSLEAIDFLNFREKRTQGQI